MLSQADATDIDARYYLSLISFTILYYDYALTFGLEISTFWSARRCNWGSVIFFVNRYVSFFGHIPVIAEMFLHHPRENICHSLLVYHNYLAMIIQINTGAIMITRTYALWGSSRKILGFLLGIVIVISAFSAWNLFGKSNPTVSGLYPGIVGCQIGLSTNHNVNMALAWAGLVVIDATIFTLTVYKSLQFERNGRQSIVNVLLRDGAMYFAVIGATALSNVLSISFGRPFSRGITMTMTNIFSSVAAARLMLNVRLHDQRVWVQSIMPMGHSSTIRFTPTYGDPEASHLREQFADNEVERPKQDDLELLPTLQGFNRQGVDRQNHC